MVVPGRQERSNISSYFTNSPSTLTLPIVLTANNYSERVAFKLIKELRKQIKKTSGYESADVKALKRACGTELKTVLRKFNDPGAVDKLS